MLVIVLPMVMFGLFFLVAETVENIQAIARMNAEEKKKVEKPEDSAENK